MVVRSALIALCLTVCQAQYVKDDMEQTWPDHRGQTIYGGEEGNPLETKLLNKLNEMETEAKNNNNMIAKELKNMAEKLENINKKIENIEHTFTINWEKEVNDVKTIMKNTVLILQEETISLQEFRQQIIKNSLSSKIDDTNTKLDTIQKDMRNVANCTTRRDYANSEAINNTTVRVEFQKLSKQLKTATSQINKTNVALEIFIKKSSDDINSNKNICKEGMDDIKKEVQELRNITSQEQEKIGNLEDNITVKWMKIENMTRHLENITDQVVKKYKGYDIVYKEGLCKGHVARGYNFKPSLKVNDGSLRYVSLTENASLIFDYVMHLAVKAEKEAIILLAPYETTKRGDSGVFEIVLGVGGSNNRTELRTRLMTETGVLKDTPNILSHTEYKTFTLRISQGKNLEFVENTSEGEKLVIKYTDDKLKDTSYISFGSWANNIAWFLYDCPKWY